MKQVGEEKDVPSPNFMKKKKIYELEMYGDDMMVLVDGDDVPKKCRCKK